MQNNNYGLSNKQILDARKKVKVILLFLFSKYIYVEDEPIALSDITSNHIHNTERYVAGIKNRVHSLIDLAKERQLVNLMITFTVKPTLHHGQVKQALDELTAMFRKLSKDRSWREIGPLNRIYFKVIEPHKDGTPHLHISLWIPKLAVSRLVKKIFYFFPAPLAHVSSTYIPEDFEYSSDGDMHIHKPDKGPVIKIKKLEKDTTAYLLKQFNEIKHDIENYKDISTLTLWYIYHNVSRFSTSRSLISMEISRKIHWYNSLVNLTKMYENGTISALWLVKEKKKELRIILYNNIILWAKKDKIFTQHTTSRWDQKHAITFFPDISDPTLNILHYGRVKKQISDDKVSVKFIVHNQVNNVYKDVSNVS